MFSYKMKIVLLLIFLTTLCNVSCENKDNANNPCKEDLDNGVYNARNSYETQEKENQDYTVSSALGNVKIEIYETKIQLKLIKSSSGNPTLMHKHLGNAR